MGKLLFCADLHGNLGQFRRVLEHARAEGFRYVVFGGDLTPKDAARRTPALQRAFLRDELFPLFREIADPEVLEVLLILGNDDFWSNRDFVVAQQRAGAPFRLIDRVPFLTEGGFAVVGYSSVPSTPFRFKCWERLVVLQHDNCGFSVPVALSCKAPCAGNGRRPWQARERRSAAPQERPEGWPVGVHGCVPALVKGNGHSLRAAPCPER